MYTTLHLPTLMYTNNVHYATPTYTTLSYTNIYIKLHLATLLPLATLS